MHARRYDTETARLVDDGVIVCRHFGMYEAARFLMLHNIRFATIKRVLREQTRIIRVRPSLLPTTPA